MAAHLTYEQQKALVFRGLKILALITAVEVLVALTAKGHLIHGFRLTEGFGHYLYMLAMVAASIYKAYFIVFNFMHLGHEVRSLAWSILLPLALLVWAIIAFFQEGDAWKNNREKIQIKNREVVSPAKSSQPQGYILPGTTLFEHRS